MENLLKIAGLCLAGLLFPALASAQQSGGAAGARETVTPQFRHALPNAPGMSLIAVTVDYPPGAKSARTPATPSRRVCWQCSWSTPTRR